MQPTSVRQDRGERWRRGGAKTGYGSVYFVQARTLGLIKIGMSGDIVSRIAALRTGSPDLLDLLGSIETENPYDLEGRIHAQFEHLRQHGEWFLPGTDLLAFISENTISSAIAPWKAILASMAIEPSDLDTFSDDDEDDLVIKLAVQAAIRARFRGELPPMSPLAAVIAAFEPSDRNLGLQAFSDYGEELRDLAMRLRLPAEAVARRR